MQGNQRLNLSGERFSVEYSLFGSRADVDQLAAAIIVEDTVEFPYELLPDGEIKDQVVGKIEEITPVGQDHYHVIISYAIEITAFTIAQFLNVVMGNISLMPGIRVERIHLFPTLATRFSGPRFGRAGVRELLGVPTRPLFCTALKPMGLSYKELADMGYQVARGGIDLIKDDHGISNQAFSQFKERISRNQEAVERANHETGRKSIFLPNITGRADELLENAHYARQIGCRGLMVLPAHTGWDAVRMLAEDDSLDLPIMIHPSFSGCYVVSPTAGFSTYAWFGQIARLAGADMSIFINFGSRFANTREDCLAVVAGTSVSMGKIKPAFPVAGGGITMQTIPEMKKVYDNDMIYLMGGGLHKAGPDLVENCQRLLSSFEA
ncbi:MAG: ribulose 1,5-bisphosphate carboxylase large subunit [Leptolinea sp.]|jgi:ribulose-bisphosphate carboxylase large chain|nr:ribulose 1,5-bisphosphate carboxylase large subunit [Leptolinea sp.]